jgi:ABC-type branched-subunit amino acid transport system substrate-binding protein
VRLHKLSLIAAATGLCITAAACSSSSKSSTPTTAKSGGTSATSAPSGPPIVLGLMTPIQSSANSQPWTLQGAKIGAAAVNAAGGVNGRPIRIDYCDDHETAQGASLCAQKLLVQDKVLMMVGDDGTEEPALIPTLSSANTISFGSMGASLQSLTSPSVYIVDPVESEYWVMPQMLPSTTKKIVYLPEESAIAQQAAKANLAFLPKTITAVPAITIPTTATSMQSYCLQIKNSGADTIVPAMDPGQVPTLVQTCNQLGLTSQLWVFTSFMLTPQLVQTVSSLHTPNLVVLGEGGGNTLQEFQADVAKYGPQVGGITNTVAEAAINAWLAVKLVPQLLQAVGSTDPAKIKAYLDQQTSFSTNGATAPINFTATPISQLPRLKNLSGEEAKIENGQIVTVNPTPFVLKMGS